MQDHELKRFGNERAGIGGPLRSRRKRGRVRLKPLVFENLFLLLTNLRAANAASLYELYFRPLKIPERTAMRRLRELVDAGFLAHVRLDGARAVYHLTDKALAVSPSIEKWAHSSLSTTPPDRQAMYCWLRASMLAALTADGWRVGNDAAALGALRRFCIDSAYDELSEASTLRHPWLKEKIAEMRASDALSVRETEALAGHRWRCCACDGSRVLAGHRDRETGVPCDGRLRAIPATPLDLAWRINGKAYDIMVLVIDNPSLPLERQLDALADVCFGVSKMRVVVRATDPRSAFDRETLRWLETGRRHAELNKAFAGDGRFRSDVEIVEYRPELQAYVARS